MVFLLMLSLGSCAPRPTAELTFRDIEWSHHGFTIRFASSENFARVLAGKSIPYSEFVCAINGDTNFDINHQIVHSLSGEFEYTGNNHSNEYVAVAEFFTSTPDRTTHRILSNEIVRAFVSKQHTIPCVVRMTVYLGRPYYSSVMQIPSAKLLNALDESAHMRIVE